MQIYSLTEQMPSQLFIKSDSVFKINTLGVFLDFRGGLDDHSALQFEIVIAHCIAFCKCQ
jgi:hypothetical protein